MKKNVFELWKENGEKLPFKIRRTNWAMPNVFILVEKIIINKYPYGTAFGKSMSITNDGKEILSKFQHHCRNGIIGCAGCFQWLIFEN